MSERSTARAAATWSLKRCTYVSIATDSPGARPKQPRRFPIERPQIAQMLVDQARRDEIVDAAAETCRGDIGFEKVIVDIAATSDRQHFRREIDAVESGDATSPEPGAGPAGSTPEISRVSDGG